jgi:CheY-like chemotaxis protein
LISNAFKFTRAGGVMLAARRRAGRCVIDVYDTGPGVATEQRDRIFEEFARTEERALGMNDGLGLGLYIARRYCDLLGMKIQLCTRLGHGSRFSIVLPQLDPIAPARFSPAAPSVRVELEGMKILVVDDEALIVTALCRDLEDRGNKAYGFGSSADAESAVIGGLSVDAAIIDFDLRGLETGVQFIDRMGERLGRTIPTLILSGGTDSETMTILGNSGKPWLTKPADPDFIVATLSAQLSKGNGPVKGDPQLARPEQKIERP